MDIDSHAGELASDLGVEKQEVAADLETLLEYDVPLNEAKQSLRRKHGGGGGGTAPTVASIGDVATTDSSVTVTGRVLTNGTRTIMYNGEERTISEGEIADETGVISYTAWETFGFAVGDTITVGNAGVREWDGEPQLNFNENTSVTTEAASLSVPYEIGGERSLVDLDPGDRGVVVEATVIECEQRTIDGRDGPTDILSGVLGDDTARLPFTDWDVHATIEAGASVRLDDCYVRKHRGVPSVNVSEFTTVTPLDRSIAVTETAPTMELGTAITEGSTFDVELRGTVIDVRDGSGLIQRCPECNRVIQNGQCRSHGAVSGVDDLRVKAIFDDGTGTATVVLGREQTERVYGGTLADAREQARDAMDKDVVTTAIAAEIVGLEHRVRGSLSVDDYGATLDATEFEPLTDDPTDRAQALLTEVNG
ncbi:Single-stranded DNA binding protein [Halocatena pleomorpha]|uniref:Single-stranded DNA binding protein n=1 Tax=Halocatena pleomorpha TaxID=1785090 RepID=A0A3P3R3X8_9EURY|nr:Single-stranded DNA binding protein [Halocatena pleomorpha]RRJ28172.1 Single-stranded DNA binding protein [Halocatena pleomorpha]